MASSEGLNSTSDGSFRAHYVYTQLNVSCKEIRTLTVHPGDDEGPVQTSLQHISLLNPTDYETISYVWGDATQRASLLVDGKVLEVHATAEKAIRRVRQASSHRVIWIDGVCINQADLDERNQQVAIMGDVYSSTKRNIVWLGDSDNSTPAAMGLIDLFWRDLLLATDGLTRFREVTSKIESRRYSDENEHCAYELKPLVAFFSNTWFERLWCVQEVALAPTNTLFCGRFEVSLLRALRVAVWCWHKICFLTSLLKPAENFSFSFDFKKQKLLADLIDTGSGELGWRRVSGWKPPLFHMLEFSMGYNVTKASDRVFALLGLINGFDPSGDGKLDAKSFSSLLMPNYAKPFVHVARDAAIATLMETGSLGVLFLVHHNGPNDGVDGISFPSWVPRLHNAWDRKEDASTSIALGHLSGEGFNVFPKGPDTPPVEALFMEDPNVLRLQGILLDPVAEISPVFTPDCLGSITSLTEQIRAVNGIAGVIDAQDPQPLVEAIARTLTATRIPEETERIFQAFLDWADMVRKVPPSRFSLLWTEDDERCRAGLESIKRVNDAVINHCTNRRFFRTKRGFLGLGPREMRPTDIVVVVHRSTLPLILPRNGEAPAEHTFLEGEFRVQLRLFHTLDTPDEYTFIGYAYVDGIMYGEAASAFRKQGGKEMSFFVR